MVGMLELLLTVAAPAFATTPTLVKAYMDYTPSIVDSSRHPNYLTANSQIPK